MKRRDPGQGHVKPEGFIGAAGDLHDALSLLALELLTALDRLRARALIRRERMKTGNRNILTLALAVILTGLAVALVMLFTLDTPAVGSDAYAVNVATATWTNYPLRVLRVDGLPCTPRPDSVATLTGNGVILLGRQDTGHAFYVPPGVESFEVFCWSAP